MLISDLFKVIRDNKESESLDQFELNNAVRNILKIKGDIDLGSDVIDLYERYDDVIDYFADVDCEIACRLDEIFSIPEVQEYVNAGVAADNESTDTCCYIKLSAYAIAIPFSFLAIFSIFNILATLHTYDACVGFTA